MTDKQYPLLPLPAGYYGDDRSLIGVSPLDPIFTEQQMRAYVDADRAQRLPLEDQAIEQAIGAKKGTPTFLVALAFCRAIEAAHGIHERKESGDV